MTTLKILALTLGVLLVLLLGTLLSATFHTALHDLCLAGLDCG